MMDSGPKIVRQESYGINQGTAERKYTSVAQIDNADPILNLAFDQTVFDNKLEEIPQSF